MIGIKSMSEAVRIVLDKYEVGMEFHGNELKRDVTRIYPDARYCYVDSCLRKLREFKRKQILCISRDKSLYKKVCK